MTGKKFAADIYLAGLHLFDLAQLYIRKPNDQIVYYNFLFSIALMAKPKVIVELGTGPGSSSLAFVRALQYNRKLGLARGVIHTCDINPDTIRKLRRFVKFDDLVIPHPITTDEFAREMEKDPFPIDLLFIDAYHSFEQCLADFNHFAPYVVPNGLILMHDMFPLSEEAEQLQYSGTAWMTAPYIKQNYREDYEISTVPYLSGIGLVRKKGAKYF
jgi:predicted O-methyltransferase YrrM